jgi:hypothetical protein
MTNHYIELQNMSASNTSEIWMLVSAEVREFFCHLVEKRFLAKRLSHLLTPDQRAGYYLWPTLQANYDLKDWMASDFRHHLRIASMLTLHLFEYRVPISDHLALQDQVKTLEKSLLECRKVFGAA